MSDGIPAAHTETTGNVLEPALKRMQGADSLRERRIGILAIEQTIQRRPENLLPNRVLGNSESWWLDYGIEAEGGAWIAPVKRQKSLKLLLLVSQNDHGALAQGS